MTVVVSATAHDAADEPTEYVIEAHDDSAITHRCGAVVTVLFGREVVFCWKCGEVVV